MLAVRSDRIIDMWVGSNVRNMGNLFQALEEASSPVLLFLDEFDTIACKRRVVTGGAGEHDNIGMVNVLLQRMDQYEGFIIAATNNANEIDPAVWRRFEIQIELGLPGHEECERILARYLKPFILPRAALAELARAFETATPALMRQFAEGMKRQIVVGPKVGWSMQKEAVLDRLIAAVLPHPELGKPRLWTLGTQDHAVRALPWPLSTDPLPEQPPEDSAGPTVIPLRRPA
jgi:SpoVK/Ycf46/Vps4 family AAA+-type ATPase